MMIGSLWLAKSAVVGAVLKFGDAAVERLAKAQFMAAIGEKLGSAEGHAVEGAANLGEKETVAGQVVKSVRQDDLVGKIAESNAGGSIITGVV